MNNDVFAQMFATFTQYMIVTHFNDTTNQKTDYKRSAGTVP